ncbi:MAG: hypothetical protein K5771_01175 [Oscillospiraceae bacterium]|nr:hypothetical protein [Oscillospiraceae bacterium]
MLDTIVKFKNVIWAIFVLIALLAVLVGLIYCLVNSYPGERVIPVVQLGEASSSSRKDSKQPDNIPASSGTAAAEAGTLNELKKCKNMGDEYIASLTFLCDSTNNSVITYGADAGKVWLGAEGTVDVNDLYAAAIRFPGDGSTVSAGDAAMISKPEILVIMIGKDGLSTVSEESFINGYKNLIDTILAQSPSTKIICCSISSVTDAYEGTITPEKVILANNWLKSVCTDKAVWYADTASEVCKDGMLQAEYASSDGISLNGAGVSAVFDYLCTHCIP